MPLFDELLMKIARNETLTPSDLDAFQQEARTLNDAKNALKSMLDGISKVKADYLNLPFVMLYNKVLVEDTASIVIEIPSIYRSLIVMGSGSIDQASGGNIWAQFNDDTGAANYAWHIISGAGAVAGALEDTSFHGVAIGLFGTTGAGAGVNGSFMAEIIHCAGPWKKNCIAHTYSAEFNDQYLIGSTWANTAAIKKMELFGTDNTLAKGTANLLSGSLFTVYGVI